MKIKEKITKKESENFKLPVIIKYYMVFAKGIEDLSNILDLAQTKIQFKHFRAFWYKFTADYGTMQ